MIGTSWEKDGEHVDEPMDAKLGTLFSEKPMFGDVWGMFGDGWRHFQL